MIRQSLLASRIYRRGEHIIAVPEGTKTSRVIVRVSRAGWPTQRRPIATRIIEYSEDGVIWKRGPSTVMKSGVEREEDGSVRTHSVLVWTIPGAHRPPRMRVRIIAHEDFTSSIEVIHAENLTD